MEFIRKNNWRYCVTACDVCKVSFDVRVDVWNKLQKERRLYRCCKCSCSIKTKTHGFSINKRKKYSTENWLYRRWQGMKKRCSLYTSYKTRNITVCPEWANSFIAFKFWAEQNGAEPTLELDRKNNDLGYFPDNCRWVTHRENCRAGGRSRRSVTSAEMPVCKSW